MANCSLKMCTLTGGTEQGNIAGPAAPLGGTGWSDSPLVLELMLGRLNADPINSKKQGLKRIGNFKFTAECIRK